MFQTATFWLVLAVTIPLFWALPKRMRLSFLSLVSVAYLGLLVYLAEESWFNAIALLGWTLLFYFLSPLTVRLVRPAGPARATGATSSINALGRRVIFWLLVGGVLGYLCWFKYVWPQILAARSDHNDIDALLVPLGISYFTFKFVHYAIEVARGNIKDRSLIRFFCYIFLFPTFSEGPIERYDHFLANQKHSLTSQAALQGMMRIIYGLIKKCILAEMLLGDFFRHITSGGLLKELHMASSWDVWGAAMGLYLYEYFDFAGYTDIAIGASQLLGLGIMENFNWPILATNVSDFWKRWHMTLTGWCVTYIYMPVMGYTRRPNLATYVTFIVIAVWHAFSKGWLLWGLWQANGLVFYQVWAKLKRRRKWTWPDKGPQRIPCYCLAIAITFLYLSAGELLTFGGVKEACFFEHTSMHNLVQFGRKLIFLKVHPGDVQP